MRKPAPTRRTRTIAPATKSRWPSAPPGPARPISPPPLHGEHRFHPLPGHHRAGQHLAAGQGSLPVRQHRRNLQDHHQEGLLRHRRGRTARHSSSGVPSDAHRKARPGSARSAPGTFSRRKSISILTPTSRCPSRSPAPPTRRSPRSSKCSPRPRRPFSSWAAA